MKASATFVAVVLAFLAGRFEAPQDAPKKPHVATPKDAPQDEAKSGAPGMQDQMAMMKKWIATMKPGERHKALEPLLGKWSTTFRFGMGLQTMETKGTAEYRWLVEGKWLIREANGSLPGMTMLPGGGAYRSFMILGYDVFQHRYVSMEVNSMETAMRCAQGMPDRTGKNIVMYGNIDEPMTGEIAKPVKFAIRIKSDDEHVQEIHDLAIGETDSKVVEIEFKRMK